MKRLILLTAVLILLFSCRDAQAPEGVLQPEAMKAVLKDVHLAEAYLNTLPTEDSVKKVADGFYQNVFKKHQTDFKQFEKSMRYYAKHPVLLDSLYSQLISEYQQVPQTKSKRPRPASVE